jgi:hypothetical protein
MEGPFSSVRRLGQVARDTKSAGSAALGETNERTGRVWRGPEPYAHLMFTYLRGSSAFQNNELFLTFQKSPRRLIMTPSALGQRPVISLAKRKLRFARSG